mmetsp:Transcript_8576/g.22119  ORF Transcript_8576/g.22119 Transcript_8576/m.22119 type:complete len:245 (+) Transcript_8576:899-1633(+)
MVNRRCVACICLASASAEASSSFTRPTTTFSSSLLASALVSAPSRSTMEDSDCPFLSCNSLISDETFAASLKFFCATAAFLTSSSWGIFSSEFAMVARHSLRSECTLSTSDEHSHSSPSLSRHSDLKRSVSTFRTFSSFLSSLSWCISSPAFSRLSTSPLTSASTLPANSAASPLSFLVFSRSSLTRLIAAKISSFSVPNPSSTSLSLASCSSISFLSEFRRSSCLSNLAFTSAILPSRSSMLP